MGSGKSTVGRRLADRLGRRFVDLDDELVATAGRSIPELFTDEGEAAFRDREHDALVTVLDGGSSLVVATGGGAVLRADNRDLMRATGRVIWLRARPDTLAARVGRGDGRPVLGDGGEDPEQVADRLGALAVERAPAYGAAAHQVVDVDDLDPDQIVDLVAAGTGAY
jgi:shikimate kinase